MKKKVKFDPQSADRSHLLHEFLTLYKEFSLSQNLSSGNKMLSFLLLEENAKSISSHAFFNPHPETHDSVENDIEQTILALKSWVEGKVDLKVPFAFLGDLKKWILQE